MRKETMTATEGIVMALTFCGFFRSVFWPYSLPKWIGTAWVGFFGISHGIRGNNYSC
jgi:hypothetical protein